MATTSVDVVVVGGGVVGTAVAAQLAGTGQRVALVEASSLAAGASGAAPGRLHPPVKGPASGPVFDLHVAETARYQGHIRPQVSWPIPPSPTTAPAQARTAYLMTDQGRDTHPGIASASADRRSPTRSAARAERPFRRGTAPHHRPDHSRAERPLFAPQR